MSAVTDTITLEAIPVQGRYDIRMWVESGWIKVAQAPDLAAAQDHMAAMHIVLKQLLGVKIVTVSREAPSAPAHGQQELPLV